MPFLNQTNAVTKNYLVGRHLGRNLGQLGLSSLLIVLSACSSYTSVPSQKIDVGTAPAIQIPTATGAPESAITKEVAQAKMQSIETELGTYFADRLALKIPQSTYDTINSERRRLANQSQGVGETSSRTSQEDDWGMNHGYRWRRAITPVATPKTLSTKTILGVLLFPIFSSSSDQLANLENESNFFILPAYSVRGVFEAVKSTATKEWGHSNLVYKTKNKKQVIEPVSLLNEGAVQYKHKMIILGGILRAQSLDATSTIYQRALYSYYLAEWAKHCSLWSASTDENCAATFSGRSGAGEIQAYNFLDAFCKIERENIKTTFANNLAIQAELSKYSIGSGPRIVAAIMNVIQGKYETYRSMKAVLQKN